MNPVDAGEARRTGSPVVRLISTEGPTGLAPPVSRSAVHRRTNQATVRIVLGLTFTCTALSLYDLVLLATGS
jgi:hypothetical protein